jgi:hypothetical protein
LLLLEGENQVARIGRAKDVVRFTRWPITTLTVFTVVPVKFQQHFLERSHDAAGTNGRPNRAALDLRGLLDRWHIRVRRQTRAPQAVTALVSTITNAVADDRREKSSRLRIFTPTPASPQPTADARESAAYFSTGRKTSARAAGPTVCGIVTTIVVPAPSLL